MSTPENIGQGKAKPPAPALGIAYDGAPMDLEWFIRNLERIAGPLRKEETGIARLIALRQFIVILKSKTREAQGIPPAPDPGLASLESAFRAGNEAGCNGVGADLAWQSYEADLATRQSQGTAPAPTAPGLDLAALFHRVKAFGDVMGADLSSVGINEWDALMDEVERLEPLQPATGSPGERPRDGGEGG